VWQRSDRYAKSDRNPCPNGDADGDIGSWRPDADACADRNACPTDTHAFT